MIPGTVVENHCTKIDLFVRHNEQTEIAFLHFSMTKPEKCISNIFFHNKLFSFRLT